MTTVAMTCALLYHSSDMSTVPEVMLEWVDRENITGVEVAMVTAGCVLVGYEDTLLRWNSFKEDLRCSSTDSNLTSSTLSQATHIQCSCPGCSIHIISSLLIILLILAVIGAVGLIWFLAREQRKRVRSPEMTIDTYFDDEVTSLWGDSSFLACQREAFVYLSMYLTVSHDWGIGI